MGRCVNHPDRETSFMCMKDSVYLCEECLNCRNPDIYCKFRSACPIWFMRKDREAWGDRAEKEARPGSCRVVIEPDGAEAEVEAGTTLLEAARDTGVHLNASCGGRGVCGKCKLVLLSGEVEREKTPLLSGREREQNYVLACMTRVKGDVTAQIPKETLARKLKVAGMGEEVTEQLRGLVDEISPMFVKKRVELQPPSLQDSSSDLDRLARGLRMLGHDTERMSLGLEVMRKLPAALRDGGWKVTASIVQKRYANEIVDIEPGGAERRSLGVAIDVGTTSIVVYLVDMSDGKVIAATSGHNRQAACGDDVINRMICAEKSGVRKLSRMALSTINGLIEEALAAAAAEPEAIDNVSVAGNTTMTHLLLEMDPRHIRREPYVPIVSSFPILRAGDIGLRANERAAVFVMPGPASYVGGDIVAGLLYSGLYREEPLTLFIDIGTNGEIVLGNRDWMMTASCSAGPAFEGGGVRWGMRAEEGAVEKVSIDRDTLEPAFSSIGGVRPRGICGSGMIDLMYEMFAKGVIGPDGRFRKDSDHPRIVEDGSETAYVVVRADETDVGEDILFTETDIENILRSKGAVYAGFKVLLQTAGLDFSVVERMWIAGGFGQYLDIEKAIGIGLLPDIDRKKFKYFGNSSIAGAYMALLSRACREDARRVSNGMTYIDFSSNDRFMDEFVSAMFLPHTNMDEFPSVKAMTLRAL
jgi:uncharacterized 2Fe-2S/4Fe-4S cluster protein (DUF4445 family)